MLAGVVFRHDTHAVTVMIRGVAMRDRMPAGVGGTELMGDTEVAQVRAAVFVEQDVGGSHVAVHNTGAVRTLKRRADVAEQERRLSER